MSKNGFFDPEALLIAFSVFFLIFVPLEKFFPLRSQSFFRKQFLTDITHFFVSSVLRKFLTVVGVVLAIRALGFLIYPPLQEFIRSLHWLVQFSVAFVLLRTGHIGCSTPYRFSGVSIRFIIAQSILIG